MSNPQQYNNNNNSIDDTTQRVHQLLSILQLLGYHPLLNSQEILLQTDERFINYSIWEWGNSKPTLLTLPNTDKEFTYLWN